MSKRIIYRCDRCKRELLPEEFVARFGPYLIYPGCLEHPDPVEEPLPLRGRFQQIRGFDFCSRCLGEILSWFPKVPEDPEGGVEQGQEEPEVEKPRKRKSLIDTEKLLALRKAGWNVKQISEELGCSMQSVYKVLNKARQKEEERRETDRAKIRNTH